MKKKILLVNEDANIREIFQMYLELKNYETYVASNGIEGLEKAKTILPDLILLDVVMPGMDGYELCRILKREDKTKGIPILFLSSLLRTSEKIKGLECGGADFINNLADYGEILARIETHLKIKELTQQLQTTNQELMLKQKTLNEDLRAAAIIQESLLPLQFPRLPSIEVSWLCRPCELIGGDICNIHQLNSDTSVFYVLDVSGHGVPSAMVTVSITQYLQQKQLLHASLLPKQALSALNQEYPFEKFNMFFTIFYMTFNSQSGKLTYSNAGHPPAVYLRPRQPLKLLDPTGPLIGVDSNFPYEEKEEYLQRGDKVILYTDGITELSNAQGEFYGEERFYSLLEEVKHLSIAEIIKNVNQALKEFGKGKNPQDDISILGIEYKQNGPK